LQEKARFEAQLQLEKEEKQRRRQDSQLKAARAEISKKDALIGIGQDIEVRTVFEDLEVENNKELCKARPAQVILLEQQEERDVASALERLEHFRRAIRFLFCRFAGSAS